MSNFLNKIPVSPITSFGNPSVPNGSTIGTNFSILQTGGYMEVYTLSGLTYTIPPATTGIIEFSGNSIPIQLTKGSGSVFSPDVLTLNSDNISSGRRKLGMLAYVYETKKIYQYNIDNYDTLWNNATGATGPGGPTVVISNFGTTVKNNSAAGIAFINAWTASTISGIGGYDDTNASWRVLSTGGGTSITGGTFNNNTDTLTLNNSTGGTVTITGFTDYYTTGFTFNPTSYDLTIKRNDGLPDLSVNLSILSSDVTITGGTYNSSTGTATFTNNTGGTFNVTGFLTGFTDIYVTGGTFNNNNRTLTLTRNDNANVNVSGFTDVFVTGGTYSSSTGVSTFRNNTGGTFNVSGYFKPSDDIYVSGGTVDQGPSSEFDNRITLNRNNASSIDITNLVNIVDITRSDIVALSKYIRGKTYKISQCDTQLYNNGKKSKGGVNTYTDIYLMGLESDKLSETGIGVFYTPKYDTYNIFVDGTFYTKDDIVIWGGYIWVCGTSGTYNSVDLFILDPAGFDISYPFDENPKLSDVYNIQYDDIIYDLTNDKITYRNEQNSNIVSTTTENREYWENLFGYNPIKVFQWGNVYTSAPNGIGNQRIINSYNENINYTGQYQKDFYFNNLSYQKNVYSLDNLSYQELFNFDNQSYQENIEFREASHQKSLYFINSYQGDVIIENGYQNNIILENQSYQESITVRDIYQTYLLFENQSYQENLTIAGFYQTNLIFNQGSQYGYQNNNQSNITIKNYNRDLSTQTGAEDGLFFINDLPNVKTEKFIGKIGNQLVEVDGLTYDGSQFVFTYNVYSTSNLTFNQISATTYLGLPLDIRVTGGTYSGSTIIFTNNTGGTFSVTGITSSGGGTFTGGTVSGATNFTNGLTANTISATTYQNLPVSGVTGGTGISANTTNGLVTIVNTAPDQIVTLSGGTGISTGGTYPNFVLTNTAPDQVVTITGGTNIGINGAYPNFGINFTGSTGASGDFLPLSGGTVTGETIFTSGLTANTISATTYQNLPTDIRVTGGTFSSGTTVFTNNTGGTFSVTGFGASTVFTGTTNTVPKYINNTTLGDSRFSDNGATGFYGGGNDLISFIPGANVFLKLDRTQSNMTFTLGNPGIGQENVITSDNTYGTSLQTKGYLSLKAGSGYTEGLQILSTGNVQLTQTPSGGTTSDYILLRDTLGNVKQISYPSIPSVSGLYLPLSGGTVSGATIFTGGLTANTISATTYYNLPTDVFVTGGTYTSGNVIFTNNTGGTFNVSGFAVGGGGGQIFYLNLSQSQNGNRLLSTTASTASEQSTGVTINNGVTGTIASFQSQPLNTTLLPGGIWSFYLHSYKENTNAVFDIFVEVYKRTSGGTETLLFATDPTPVTTNSPNPSMQLSDGYFSGTSLSVSDGVVAVVRATNTDNQPHIITLVTEGSDHYSYVVSTIPTQQGLTCDTLSGCSIIQTIQTDVSNKLDKSGGTITGNLIINSGLTANTISATTYNGYIPLPTQAGISSGVTLSYITDEVYGSIVSPETGTTITANTVNAVLGVTNILIHNSSSSPTFSSEFKKLSGSGDYVINVVNYIFSTYITSTEIIYSINQRV